MALIIFLHKFANFEAKGSDPMYFRNQLLDRMGHFDNIFQPERELSSKEELLLIILVPIIPNRFFKSLIYQSISTKSQILSKLLFSFKS
ncbi:unnamed protein product [Moneuplotes crassus]|uniref:Uncharacterized protein n=1 Tax=Euplotes crassus TaxID=5936 RepID=A0AAD1XT83_EUPCR|nr:unnamed protein product [Moneuplotes crassus]